MHLLMTGTMAEGSAMESSRLMTMKNRTIYHRISIWAGFADAVLLVFFIIHTFNFQKNCKPAADQPSPQPKRSQTC